MDKYMPYILDILVIVILFHTTYRGYRNGLIRTVAGLFGYLGALVVASVGSKLIGNLIVTASRNSLIRMVSDKVGTMVNLDREQIVSLLYENIPSYLMNPIQQLIGTPEELASKIDLGTVSFAENLTDSVLIPVISTLVQALLFFLLFAICSYLIRRLVRAMDIFQKVPFVGSLNAVLGGILGCLQSIIILLVISTAVSLLLALTGGISDVLTAQSISQTYLFQIFYKMNPFSLS